MPGPKIKEILNSKWVPLIIAALLGILALVYYILSGRGSLDTNIRTLSQGQSVQKIDSSDASNIVITCKNGRIYKITFTEDRQNYDDFVFNACGPAGIEEGTQE